MEAEVDRCRRSGKGRVEAEAEVDVEADAEEEVEARMNIDRSNEVKRYLIELIQQELHDNNELIRRFKTAHDVIRSEGEPHEELSIVINDENRPPGEHRGINTFQEQYLLDITKQNCSVS